MMLAKELDFTDEDLAANRRGELTDHQRSRLRRKRLWALIIVGVMQIPPLMGSIIVLQDPLDAGGVFVLVVAIVWILFFSLIGWLTMTETCSDLRTGRVLSVTGKASLHKAKGRSGYFHLHIDSFKFPIRAAHSPYGVSNTFKAGQRYQVFYTPATKMILSAVWLDN